MRANYMEKDDLMDEKTQHPPETHEKPTIVAKKFGNNYPWLANRMVCFLIGILFAFVLDLLVTPVITNIILWVVGFNIDVHAGQKDLGAGVVFIGTSLVVFIISFPVWAWISIKRMFNLLSVK